MVFSVLCVTLLLPVIVWSVCSKIDTAIRKKQNHANLAALILTGLVFSTFVVVLDGVALHLVDQGKHEFSSHRNFSSLTFVIITTVLDAAAVLIAYIILLYLGLPKYIQEKFLESCKKIVPVCCKNKCLEHKKAGTLWIVASMCFAPLFCIASHSGYIIVAWVSDTQHAGPATSFYLISFLYYFIIFRQLYKLFSKVKPTSCPPLCCCSYLFCYCYSKRKQRREEDEERRGARREDEGEERREGGARREDEGEEQREGGARREDEGEEQREGGARREDEGEEQREGGARREDEGEEQREGGARREDEGEEQREGGARREDEGEEQREGGARRENEGVVGERGRREEGEKEGEEEESIFNLSAFFIVFYLALIPVGVEFFMIYSLKALPATVSAAPIGVYHFAQLAFVIITALFTYKLFYTEDEPKQFAKAFVRNFKITNPQDIHNKKLHSVIAAGRILGGVAFTIMQQIAPRNTGQGNTDQQNTDQRNANQGDTNPYKETLV